MKRISQLRYVGFWRQDDADRFDRLKSSLPERLSQWAQQNATEHFLVDTCERIELYFARRSNAGPALDAQSLRKGYAHAAARHLLRVAVGLESRIVGESQIRQQVRSAVLFAQEAGTLGPLLTKLAQMAIHFPRRVAQHTNFGTNVFELDQLAVEAAFEFRGRFHESTLTLVAPLIVGTGNLARKIARLLSLRGVSQFTFASQEFSRAQSLADQFFSKAITNNHLRDGIQNTGVVFLATNTPSCLIDETTLSGINHPLLIIDLSVPRVTSPLIGQFPNVHVLDPESLSTPAKEVVNDRHLVEWMLDEQLEKLVAWDRGDQALISCRCRCNSERNRTTIRISGNAGGRPVLEAAV